jgi:archaellum component FlaC
MPSHCGDVDPQFGHYGACSSGQSGKTKHVIRDIELTDEEYREVAKIVCELREKSEKAKEQARIKSRIETLEGEIRELRRQL